MLDTEDDSVKARTKGIYNSITQLASKADTCWKVAETCDENPQHPDQHDRTEQLAFEAMRVYTSASALIRQAGDLSLKATGISNDDIESYNHRNGINPFLFFYRLAN
jgi:hypothetical protein